MLFNSCLSWGLVCLLLFQLFFTTVLLSSRAGHWTSRWTRSPGRWRPGHRRQSPSGLVLSQYRHKWSVLYRPLSREAAVLHLLDSKGFAPHVVKIGWGLERDMNSGLKNWREERREAWWRRCDCQWSRTWDFTCFLKVSFLGGFERSTRGVGRSY